MRLVFAALLAVHGLIHLLYAAQSLRLFELQPGMTWPDGAWSFSWLPADTAVRLLAASLMALIAAGFVTAGVALALGQAWWQPLALAAAVVSTIALVLLWNGRLQGLDAQGLYAVLIDAAILLSILVFRWPDVAS